MGKQNYLKIVEECPNYDENLESCPCTSEDCARRGLCCQCVANHRAKGNKTACMK